MKKSILMYLLVVACAIVSLVGCGGGGGGTPNSDVSESPLSEEGASNLAIAITNMAHGISQSISGGTADSVYKTVKQAQDSGSFSGVATGIYGGSCELNGSGVSEYDTDPMTFSVTGTMICDSYGSEVNDVLFTLHGSIDVTMTGTISQDHSSIDMSFDMEWTDLDVDVGHQAGFLTGMSGNYSVHFVGNGDEFQVIEDGVIDGYSISRTRPISYIYSTGVYNFFTDNWVVYAGPSLYLGEYLKDESANPDTCSNSVFFGYEWLSAVEVTSLSGASVSGTLLGDAVSVVYDYDPAYPHFQDSDELRYWYIEPSYSCLATFASLPSVIGDGYKDYIVFACSDGVDVCGIDYSRENASTLTTVKSTAVVDQYDDQNRDLMRERAIALQVEVMEMVNNR